MASFDLGISAKTFGLDLEAQDLYRGCLQIVSVLLFMIGDAATSAIVICIIKGESTVCYSDVFLPACMD